MYDGETATIVKKIPEIDCDGSTNSDEREQTDVFRTHDKRKCHARSNKPCPPLFRERLMSIRVEFDIHPNRHCNTKHQRRIQKNQSLLCQLCIIYHEPHPTEERTETYHCACNKTGNKSIPGITHDAKGRHHSQGT